MLSLWVRFIIVVGLQSRIRAFPVRFRLQMLSFYVSSSSYRGQSLSLSPLGFVLNECVPIQSLIFRHVCFYTLGDHQMIYFGINN